jgi:hypothetical protein
VLALVRRARRRLYYNELFAQGANAASAALAAFILLLLLGTEILSWQFTLIIPVIALALGFYIARRRVPSPYAVAQTIDRRLGFADTLSTALFFSESTHGQSSPGIVRLQSETAERLAETADLRRAIPFTVPRTAYAMAALVLVAGSLFALRYGISKRLDLKEPLAAMLQQTFRSPEKTEQARSKMPKVPRPDIAPDSDMSSSDQQEQRAGDPQDPNTDRADESTETPGKADSKSPEGNAKKQQENGDQANSDQQDASNDDRAGNDSDKANSGQQGDSKQESKQGNSKQDANNSGENSSMMSKFKDAVQNLLSRMKPQQNQSSGQQQSGEQNNQQGKGQQNGGKQQSAKNGQQQPGDQQSDAQDGQAGEQSQNAQDQQGKGTGNSDSKQASKQPGSGVGSQDGDKQLKAAEQLAAMGKITEIIGKRSQTISGETTVEVQATSQQLRTQYSNRNAQHTQATSEIGRDEVPVALQNYVEQYFEQVRKQAPPPKK